MTAMRDAIFKPRNPLAAVLRGDGASAEALIASGEARVEALADEIRAFVAARLAEIAALAQATPDLQSEAERLRDLAVQVAEVAGAAGQEAVGEAARGLVAMLEEFRSTGCWQAAATAVHVDTLALIARGSGAHSVENGVLLGKLEEMRQRLGVSS